jgi:hypothetical protein
MHIVNILELSSEFDLSPLRMAPVVTELSGSMTCNPFAIVPALSGAPEI